MNSLKNDTTAVTDMDTQKKILDETQKTLHLALTRLEATNVEISNLTDINKRLQDNSNHINIEIVHFEQLIYNISEIYGNIQREVTHQYPNPEDLADIAGKLDKVITSLDSYMLQSIPHDIN